ncbi:hypothetical protein F5I97DRAFT_1859637 [Phlebopus sp. FC_14]|nr:hypothetical protein F5I97DRAFT_1859637 [Phlebopus sp. FC_14]
MSPTTTTAHALEHTSFWYPDVGDYAQKPTQEPSRWNRGPTRKRYRQSPKKAKQKSVYQGAHDHKPPWPKKRPAEQNTLLNRLSPPSTLLDRIGVQINGEADLDVTASDSVPCFYTPEPGEVEVFLESVIGAPPQTPTDACLVKRIRPTLAVDTQHLDYEAPVKLEQQPSSLLYPPTVTPVNGPSLEGNTLDVMAMTGPSSSTLEQCRKHLVPVILSALKESNTGTLMDSEQCAALLTDDKCRYLLHQAKEMRRQMLDLPRRSSEVNVSSEGSKRDRVGEDDNASRNKRGRFDSVDDDVSRRDSDATLVDFPVVTFPQKSPHAMPKPVPQVQDSLETGKASPGVAQITEQIPRLPAPASGQDGPLDGTVTRQFHSTSDHEIVIDGTVSIPGPQTIGAEEPASRLPSDSSIPGAVHPIPDPLTTPGVWFKRIGHAHSDVLDIDFYVSSDLFLSSRSSINMDVRFCCFRKKPETQQEIDFDAPPEDLRAAICSGACQWPKKGSLVIQVNRDFQYGKTWLPASDSQSLNVSSCIMPGKNTFRFIQLSDLSDFTFALLAFVPLPEDAWKGWDWAATLKPSLLGDQPSGILTEFARIPFVTLQS